MSMLKVENITKNFGKTKAIDGLSFSMQKGDITGLLGPNGAGKTTTMRVITSFYYPTKGKVIIDGLNTQLNTSATQYKIGYLPEDNPLYQDMLVVDYLMMTAKLNGVKKNISNKIKNVAKTVGIKSKLVTPINNLSKGYKQRVGLAAALIHNPSLIILDEPTEGLDPNQREELHKLIKKLSKNKAILISTHVLQEVKAMCNKVVVINDGKLVTAGSPDALTKTKTLEVKLEGSNIKSVLSKLLNKDNEKYSIDSGKSKIKSVKISSDRELRPQLSELSANNNWIIWEMRIQDSLEEVFRKLKT